jgi:hypothetical protein
MAHMYATCHPARSTVVAPPNESSLSSLGRTVQTSSTSEMTTARSKSVEIAIVIVMFEPRPPGFEAFEGEGEGPASEGLGFKESQSRP